MTKTWQEDFDERFPHIIKNLLDEELRKYPNLTNEFWEAIKQFISDLRKKDEEELIKMLPHYCLEHEVEVNITELIKDYYENN